MAMIEGSSSSELPEALKEEILKRLPLEYLCRCRSVCQQWNTLFTSTSFITTLWANFPSNKQPSLVLCGLKTLDPQNRCCTYCFSTRTWKSSFPLSFLEGTCSDAYCQGSAAGLLLVDILSCQERSVPSVFSFWKKPIVCNPVTGRSLTLPSSPSMRFVVTKGIVAGDFDGNRQTYKVVVVTEVFSRRDKQVAGLHRAPRQNVEIYDSSEKTWSVATRIPENVSITGVRMVFSKGYFYCKATCYSGKLDIVGRRGIVGVSLQNESFMFVPLPGLANDNMCHHLVACGSRVLLARCVLEDNQKILKEVHIWGLVKVKVDSNISASWMEIARMPQSMCDEVRTIWPTKRSFEFVGVGDFVCFRGCGSINVAMYSLTEKLWSWLPSCPLQNNSRDATWIYPFEPRPDMKVI